MHVTQKVLEHQERIKTLAIICDLCQRCYDGATRSNWATQQFDIERTTLSYESGTVFPEGGSTEVISVDICPTCFTEKLVPWLQSQGAPVTTSTIDI